MTGLEVYLLAGLAILSFNTLLWLISLRLQNSSIIDPFWSLLFLIAAVIYYDSSKNGFAERKILLLVLLLLWGIRLAGYLLWRSWGKPEDFRYQKWRAEAGSRWWWQSYFKVFVLQGILAWIISIPLLAAQHNSDSSAWPILDSVAVLVWSIGFFFEAVGDLQLARFRANVENKGKVLNTGLWRYTRHPNYFGEALIWWGYYLLALAAGGFWTIYAPFIMTGLLLRVSGVALLEKTLVDAKPQYRQYIQTTSAFIPRFPKNPGDGQA